MGREWYFSWGSKSSTKKGGIKGGDGDDGDGGGGSDKKSVKRPQAAAVVAPLAAAGGCMNAMLHLFDFHHLHLCLHSQNSSYLPDDPTTSKGIEAPRNSLEKFNTHDKHKYSLDVPMDIQNKKNRRDTNLKMVQAPRCKVEDILSEKTCSPATGTRTPTLVARLMGLDILPESNNNTPRSSSSSYSHRSTHTPHITSTETRKKSTLNNDVPHTRSPPESPRSSSSSSTHKRRSWNAVDKHRLSLQIDKENKIVKEMESSRPSCSAINTKRREGRKYEDENKSPGYYARQIMKQVKETVSRRVGADITNTIEQRQLRRDENLLSTKTPTKTKKSRLLKSSEVSQKVSETPTKPKKSRSIKSSEISQKVSEKLRALDESMCDVQEDVPTKDKLQVKPKTEEHYCADKVDTGLKNFGVVTKPCPKTSPKSYESIKSRKDEQFVRQQTRANSSATEKNCKKMTLSTDFVHGSVPSIVPLKKEFVSPQAHPKLLREQGLPKVQMTKHDNNISTNNTTPTWSSRSPSQRPYEKMQEATHKPADHEKKKGSVTTSSSIEEFQYISRILKCTGIDRDTPIYFTKWFSPSHPLNPTIYHSLEISHYLTPSNTDHYSPSDIHLTRLSIDRKLIFHLVDEILADLLNPNHQRQQYQINGLQLVKTLCTKIQSLPSSNCQTLQDIDAIIEKDMSIFGTMSNLAMFEEECDTIVTEIEHDIIESLVQEMALFC
ncbi:hypothetical protein vseg_014635 [Gypsophila vaccaria]